MRLSVEKLPTDGRDVNVRPDEVWSLEAARIAMGQDDVSVSGSLRIEGGPGRVVVHAELHSESQLDCERCGESVPVVVDVDADLTYLPARSSTTAPEVELGADDLDVGFFEGEALDLVSVVSEALALELPHRILCSDTGACQARVDALFTQEDPGTEPVNNGFASLAGLKLG